MRLELNLDFAKAFDPSEFFFGVANAPYLCEGGYNTPEGPKNNYGVLEESGRIERSGESTRFWTTYREHIALAASLGLNAFRMGLEWARIQPTRSYEPGDPPPWDEFALDRYAEIVRTVIDSGMQPIITLHHFAFPAWLGRHLWLNDQASDMLVDYEIRVVDAINARLGAAGSDLMRHFLVYNEPNQVPLQLFMRNLFPIPQGPEFLLPAFDNMLARYVRVYDGLYDLFEARGWGKPHVGYTVASQSAYEFDRQMDDVLRLRTNDVAREGVAAAMAGYRTAWRRHIDDLAHSQLTDLQYDRYLERIELTARSVPPGELTKTLDALYSSPRARKLDYISLNVYHPFGAHLYGPEDPSRSAADIYWDEFVMDSEVYRTFILATNEGNTDLPFYMGENSCANLQPIGGAATVRPDGWNRERFLKTSIMEVIRCMKEGVPIKGYLYWGLVDDFEWQAGFAPRLGLYNYDYVNGLINPTDGFGEPSGQVYAHLVAALRSGRKGLIQDCFVRTYAASLTRSGR